MHGGIRREDMSDSSGSEDAREEVEQHLSSSREQMGHHLTNISRSVGNIERDQLVLPDLEPLLKQGWLSYFQNKSLKQRRL